MHTPKSLGVTTAKYPEGDPAGQFSGPPHPTHCPPKVQFHCGLTVLRKWGGAPPRLNHICCCWWRGAFWRALINHLTKLKGARNLSVYQVRQLVIRTDMLRCPPRHWWKIYVYVLKWLWCGDFHSPWYRYYESSQ